MKKLIQTRLTDPANGVLGNCFASVIACILDKDSPEDVIQIQEYYETDPNWMDQLSYWLDNHRWELSNKPQGHDYNTDQLYLVSGRSPRNPSNSHICIYQRGILYYDPHPTHSGIVTEEYFYDLLPYPEFI
jgi:hypothetical protein